MIMLDSSRSKEEASYIVFLLSTVYFAAKISSDEAEKKWSAFSERLLPRLSPKERTLLNGLSATDFTFKDLILFFDKHLSVEMLGTLPLDFLELEFRSCVRFILAKLSGDKRDQFKKELLEEYKRYHLTDI